ncbi:hypothetical protein WOLCODRAFT_136627, partial [Wolfiporia cocos MD-104 SS10]
MSRVCLALRLTFRNYVTARTAPQRVARRRATHARERPGAQARGRANRRARGRAGRRARARHHEPQAGHRARARRRCAPRHGPARRRHNGGRGAVRSPLLFPSALQRKLFLQRRAVGGVHWRQHGLLRRHVSSAVSRRRLEHPVAQVWARSGRLDARHPRCCVAARLRILALLTRDVVQ